MDLLNLAEWAAIGTGKAAAGLPQSKKERSKLRHYKELLHVGYLSYGDMRLRRWGCDFYEGGRVC